MKNKVSLVIFIIILLISGILYTANVSSDVTTENVLSEGLNTTEAEALESTISCWNKINDTFLSSKQVTEEMDNIIIQLGIDKSDVERIVDNNESTNKEIIYATKDNKTYEVVVESINNDNKGETYVIADVYINGNSKDFTTEKEKLALILKGNDEHIKSNSCVIGTFEGRLTNDEIQQKIGEVLISIKAKKVEGIENQDMTSISAYSSIIGSYIVSNNKRVNIQVALRYSAYDDKTYIWIGSPLIHVEY